MFRKQNSTNKRSPELPGTSYVRAPSVADPLKAQATDNGKGKADWICCTYCGMTNMQNTKI